MKPTIPLKVTSNHEVICVCGYKFVFVQNLAPKLNQSNHIQKFYPLRGRNKRKGKEIHNFGRGASCRFRINAPEVSGVYLWVVDNEIIYVGETQNLSQRFNQGYGRISASNCYKKSGSVTNCRMNKALLQYSEQSKIVSLYFYETKCHKAVEKKILGVLKTRFNAKH